jgi:hypothetical protein
MQNKTKQNKNKTQEQQQQQKKTQRSKKIRRKANEAAGCGLKWDECYLGRRARVWQNKLCGDTKVGGSEQTFFLCAVACFSL